MEARFRIWNLPSSEEEAIVFLQRNQLLPQVKLCGNGHEMKLYSFNKSPFWKCLTRPCLKKTGLRVDTWFSNSKLPFVTAIRFIYCWASELTSLSWCDSQLNMSGPAVVDWNNYLREVCVFSLQNNTNKIGGTGLVVEINETLFTRYKNHAGRVLPEQWVFGGLCRETGGGFLVPVPDRSAATLMQKIVEYIKPGSTIMSDSWKGFEMAELEEAGFEDFTVNHKYDFMDPKMGGNTLQIERMWGAAKWRNEKHQGMARHHIDSYSYLAEFMWRTRVKLNGGDPFVEILGDIESFWASLIKRY